MRLAKTGFPRKALRTVACHFAVEDKVTDLKLT
jgi:hypothetical protein